MYYDVSYILLIIGAVITMAASFKVKGAFNKYSKIRSYRNITGAEVASRILRENGIHDVEVRPVSGSLSDHYNPKSKTVNLSETVYGSNSIAAIAVAAHECGHAIQHHDGYAPLNFRSALVPLANIGSRLGVPLIMISFILGLDFEMANGAMFSLADIGIWIFSFAVLFQFMTLPVEFNASSRALRILENGGILEGEEMRGARRMLSAAALTYVAAAAASVLQLIRFIALSNSRKSRR